MEDRKRAGHRDKILSTVGDRWWVGGAIMDGMGIWRLV